MAFCWVSRSVKNLVVTVMPLACAIGTQWQYVSDTNPTVAGIKLCNCKVIVQHCNLLSSCQ